MSQNPLVTIITPSYNQAAFLEETIQSVLSQEYPNFEYWVIDGGSTDGSVEIIQKYAGRLAGWVSEKDKGQADAINKGFARAKGEIVAWLNSDDLYRTGAIRSAVTAFEENPEVGLVYSDVDSIDGEGEVFNRMRYSQWGLRDLMVFNILGQPGVFLRRSVLESAGHLDLSYRYLLDHHLWLRMALEASIKYSPGEVWAAARIHAGAKNVAEAEGFGKEAYRLVEWMKGDERFTPYLKGYLNRVWAGAHRLNAFYLLNGRKPGSALKAYWRGFWQHPRTVLKDWRRIGFALLNPFKLDKLRDGYLAKKKKRIFDE